MCRASREITLRSGLRAPWGFLLSTLTAYCLGLSASLVGDAEELRDPFTFGPRTDVESKAGPMLVGVLWDPTHPLAMVGEQAVAVGDHIGAWEVVEIQQGGMVVQHGERRELVAPGNPLPSE